MKINKTILTNKLNKLAVKASKKAPTVLVVGGVCGVAVSTVLACKATLKVNEILEEAKSLLKDKGYELEVKVFEGNPKEGATDTEVNIPSVFF